MDPSSLPDRGPPPPVRETFRYRTHLSLSHSLSLSGWAFYGERVAAMVPTRLCVVDLPATSILTWPPVCFRRQPMC